MEIKSKPHCPYCSVAMVGHIIAGQRGLEGLILLSIETNFFLLSHHFPLENYIQGRKLVIKKKTYPYIT